jgi:hypothetical protein
MIHITGGSSSSVPSVHTALASTRNANQVMRSSANINSNSINSMQGSNSSVAGRHGSSNGMISGESHDEVS